MPGQCSLSNELFNYVEKALFIDPFKTWKFEIGKTVQPNLLLYTFGVVMVVTFIQYNQSI